MRTKILFIVSLLFSIQASKAFANDQVFASGEKRVSLIELYTSEGCSSCPPAERWMAGLAKEPRLWKDFIPAAFHVDYWDYLGWKDIFSTREASARQSQYAKVWSGDSIFTPAVVKNGRLWQGGGDSSSLSSNEIAPELELKIGADRHWSIEAKGAALKSQTCLEISVATLDQATRSKVKAGENRGETLLHTFSVLHWETQRLKNNATIWNGSGVLEPRGDAAIAWLSACHSPSPLQAVGGPLNH